MHLPIRVIVLASLALAPAQVFPTSAQENLGGNVGQSGEGGSGGGSQPQAQTAQAGAGTTNGTTTGFSGPKNANGKAPGQNELPPLPSSQLCESYRNTPAVYQSCLWVTLRN